MKSQKIVIGVAMVMVVALLVSSAAAVASFGSLSVNTTPSNASVVLDGKEAGMTPLFIGNLTAAKHSVVISKEGYKQVRKNVIIRANKTQTINEKLVKIQPTKTPTVKPTKTPTVKPTKTPTKTPTTNVTPTKTPVNITVQIPTSTPVVINGSVTI